MRFRAEPRVEITCTAKWIDVAEACRSEDPPDLVILDLNMPEVRGEIVGMGVRGDGGTVPIVIFSSEADRRLQMAATAVGARTAIAKADAERLVGEVMRILESSC